MTPLSLNEEPATTLEPRKTDDEVRGKATVTLEMRVPVAGYAPELVEWHHALTEDWLKGLHVLTNHGWDQTSFDEYSYHEFTVLVFGFEREDGSERQAREDILEAELESRQNLGFFDFDFVTHRS